jgi:hypothetical protein
LLPATENGDKSHARHKRLNLQYVTNVNGEQTAFIIPIADFRDLLEEIEDLTAIAERRQEPTSVVTQNRPLMVT